ncbi:MAG: RNA polymerase sigma factor [Candidatus Promineifilaceae bacterium]|nr:RNA polymerase sigma factor [Candidatus Promineifilaceae bacterium]
MAGTPDPDALTALVVELYEAYYSSLFAYVYQLVGDAEWAHDLVQESFLRLYRERGKLEVVENRRAWIYRIASNVAFTALRRRRRRIRLPWQAVEEMAMVAPDPTAQAGQQQMDVEQALATLPAHYRAPLLLFSSYGLSVREVAAALGLSETAVTTRLYRARKLFREAYGGGDDERGKER